jgi:hypothetical protein
LIDFPQGIEVAAPKFPNPETGVTHGNLILLGDKPVFHPIKACFGESEKLARQGP